MTECQIQTLAYKLSLMELAARVDWSNVAAAVFCVAIILGFLLLGYIAVRR